MTLFLGDFFDDLSLGDFFDDLSFGDFLMTSLLVFFLMTFLLGIFFDELFLNKEGRESGAPKLPEMFVFDLKKTTFWPKT